MSAKTLPAERVGADADAGPQSPPDPAEVYRLTTALMRWMHPGVRNLRIVGEVPAAGGVQTVRLPVPDEAVPADLAAGILKVLAKLRPGEWMKGRNVAWEIDEDLDHKGGSFKRAVAELIEDDKIESGRLGYRLIS